MAKLGELTPKQEAFCREYLIDLNATQAAIRSGYSEKTAQEQGSRLLSNAIVKQYIDDQMGKRAKRTEITADYVLEKIKETIERCSQAEPVMEWDALAQEYVRTGEWKFEHSGVLKGCELLGKHLKLFTDKVEAKVEGEVEVKVSRVDLSERVKQLKGEE